MLEAAVVRDKHEAKCSFLSGVARVFAARGGLKNCCPLFFGNKFCWIYAVPVYEMQIILYWANSTQ